MDLVDVVKVDSFFWCEEVVAYRCDVYNPYISRLRNACCREEYREEERSKEIVRQIVGLPLCFIAIFAELERERHDAGIVDKAVESGFFGCEVGGGGFDRGEIHVIKN